MLILLLGKLFIERSEDGLCGWIPANITKVGLSKVSKTDKWELKVHSGWPITGKIDYFCYFKQELQSDHMRARNFKQRYQFLKALAELDMAETWEKRINDE